MDNHNNRLPKLAIVCVPYANVYLDPIEDPAKLDTQVLYYEPVTIIEEQGEWYKVATSWQMKIENNHKIPHEGWINATTVKRAPPYTDEENSSVTVIIQTPKAQLIHTQENGESAIIELFAGTKLYSCVAPDRSINYQVNKPLKLSINTSDTLPVKVIHKLTTQEKRNAIIQHALKFLNTPYVWGGLTKEGIDCSGLTHVCYRLVDVRIPRDSKDQYLDAKPRYPKDLKQGDLIFLARTEDPTRIRHVMLYGGNDRIIDAIGTDRFSTKWEKVRETTGQEWLKKSFTQMNQAEEINGYVVYGGSILER